MSDLINEKVEEDLLKKYPSFLNNLCCGKIFKGFNNKLDFEISTDALAQAIREFKVDVDMLILRRENKSPSWGKIAGALTFRLTRSQIAFPKNYNNHTMAEKKLIRNLPILNAIALPLEHFCNIDLTTQRPKILKELMYTIFFRHMNQETIGLCYDILIEENE